MKNRSCPDKIACWYYDANKCEGCAVGDLILRQKKSIKRLKSELERHKRALIKKCESEADSTCPDGYNPAKCKECDEKDLCSTDYAAQCYYEKALQEADREIEEERK